MSLYQEINKSKLYDKIQKTNTRGIKMSKSEDELFSSSVVSYKVLILCKGNTCRSIVFHSIADSLKKANHEYFSAGINVIQEEIEENTIKALSKIIVEPIKTKTNKLSDYEDSELIFDEVILLDNSIDKKMLKNLQYRKITEMFLEDPYGKNLNDYIEVAKKIRNNLTSR